MIVRRLNRGLCSWKAEISGEPDVSSLKNKIHFCVRRSLESRRRKKSVKVGGNICLRWWRWQIGLEKEDGGDSQSELRLKKWESRGKAYLKNFGSCVSVCWIIIQNCQLLAALRFSNSMNYWIWCFWWIPGSDLIICFLCKLKVCVDPRHFSKQTLGLFTR